MDGYGWKVKQWKFTQDNMDKAYEEMKAWKEKWKNKYQMREIFVNNAYAVEYRLLLHK